MLSTLAAAVTVWCGWALAFTAVALVTSVRLAARSRRYPAPRRWPSVAVLRPCEGPEERLAENLASSLAGYPGERRVLLLVPSIRDPSYAVARAVVAADRTGAVEVLVTGVRSRLNRKCVQLAAGLARVASDEGRPALPGLPAWAGAPVSPGPRSPASPDVAPPRGLPDVAPSPVLPQVQPSPDLPPVQPLTVSPMSPPVPEVIVQADSDVHLDEGALRALVTALVADDRNAAAFAVPVELEGRTAGDFAASALLSASPQDFLALAGVTTVAGGVTAMAGALAAHRTTDLVAAGGFAPFEALLGEDFELSRRQRARGRTIALSDRAAVCSAEGRTLGEVLARTARWATVVRRQRGPLLMALYPLFLAATPPLLLLASLLLLLGQARPALAALALLALRTVLAWSLRRIHRIPVSWPRALALVLAGELLILSAYPRALLRSVVVWRGRRLRVGRGGTIEPVG